MRKIQDGAGPDSRSDGRSGNRSGSRSTQRLREATLRLLDERGPESVTITEIVTEAGVTRPTFYAAFGDLPTAFADAALSRLEDAFAGMTLASDLPEAERADAMAAAFTAILHRLDQHAAFFAAALHGPGGVEVHERIVGFLAERVRETSPLAPAIEEGPLPLATTSTALAAAIVWTIRVWLDDPARSSVEEIAVLLRDLVLHAVIGGLGGPQEGPQPAESSGAEEA
ncbi:TetR/AcrR family transcriptional regulator [Brachybacterium sp. DNPG3]